MESPTPWHVGGIGGCRPKLVYDASGRTILRSWGNRSDEEDDANVELAAQAPKLREQVRILREALEKIRRGASVTGRWIDSSGNCAHAEGHDEHEEGFPPDDHDAVWETYDLDEQNAQLECIAEQASAALEATKEEA